MKKSEHYVHTKGKTTRTRPVVRNDTITMKPIAQQERYGLNHSILLVLEEEWTYLFCILTLITAKTGETVYEASTWFPSLPDLLDYLAKYLPPEKEGAILPLDENVR